MAAVEPRPPPPIPSPRFLDLPAETRLQIYGMTLCGDLPFYVATTYEADALRITHFRMCHCNRSFPHTCEGFRCDMALLRTNRQIHSEAACVQYGGNKFRFACPRTLLRFLGDIGSNSRHLRHVELLGCLLDSDWPGGPHLILAAKAEAERTFRDCLKILEAAHIQTLVLPPWRWMYMQKRSSTASDKAADLFRLIRSAVRAWCHFQKLEECEVRVEDIVGFVDSTCSGCGADLSQTNGCTDQHHVDSEAATRELYRLLSEDLLEYLGAGMDDQTVPSGR